jgi:hypothetical protein
VTFAPKSSPLHPGRAFAAFLCLFALFVPCARASVALFMEEPYGEFGAFNPTGHAAVYFNHICADSYTMLRPCRAGEYGVVISRYHKIDHYDWIAIPLIDYLYAVKSLDEIPASVDKDQVAHIRDAYRRKFLLTLAPDDKHGNAPRGEWTQLIGSSYDRTIHGFQVDSTPDQDERFMAIFNDKRNVGHFNLFFRNCADFSRTVLDIYLPHSVHRNFIADLGITTPKQVARALVKYGKKHPELHMTAFIIPQIPGKVARSHGIDGVTESLVKSKKYLIPLVILAPEVTGGVVAAYLVDGRARLPKTATVFEIGDEETTDGTLDAASRDPGSTPLPVPAAMPAPATAITPAAASVTAPGAAVPSSAASPATPDPAQPTPAPCPVGATRPC